MIAHDTVYRLARKLKLLNESESNLLPKGVKSELLHNHQAYLKNEKTYNTRCRAVKYLPGQEVYRRNFRQSEFKSEYNAKPDNKFLRCRITRPVGNSLYELEDLKGRIRGLFHAKDLKE